MGIAAVPYGFRHRGAGPEGLYRVGDQLSVIPSFTGDGVAMALHSGLAAAAAILAGVSAPRFHQAWASRSARPMRWAAWSGAVLRRSPGLFLAGARLPLLPGLIARATRLPHV